MSVPMRIVAYAMASVMTGCNAAVLDTSLGLARPLLPYVKKNGHGCYYLASAKHRQLVQVRVEEELIFADGISVPRNTPFSHPLATQPLYSKAVHHVAQPARDGWL